MLFTDLNPRLIGSGVQFDCPCGGGKCVPLYIPFADTPNEHGNLGCTWGRKGDSFDNITLTPSIRRMDNCKWHGYVTDGRIVNCSDWRGNG